MLYNKISIIMLAGTTTIFLVSIILSMSTFINISAFAQAEGTNQTGEAIKQNVSDVITNISKGAKSTGSNITTEVAKEIADNIGKKLQDLAK
jgi:uncharacterized protein YycO